MSSTNIVAQEGEKWMKFQTMKNCRQEKQQNTWADQNTYSVSGAETKSFSAFE